MNIEMDKEQYRTLVELLFLGNWIANATRTGSKDDRRIKKYDDIQKLIHAYASDLQSEDFILKDRDDYYTTLKFEESLMPIVEHYDKFTFMEQLPNQLAERDWLRELGPVHKITEKQIERRNELIELYEEEIFENGLKNIEIKNIRL